jgi:DtxR family Mn-dependent transcriptional regulator
MIASARLEDYLEAVFSLEIAGEEPTVTGLAEELKLTKGTIVTGIKKLVKNMMLEHEPYGTVRLTESGRQKALTIFRRHENVSFIFTEILGLEREKAENLACIMEHEMDERTEQKLCALGDFFCRSKMNGEEWMSRLQEELKSEQRLPRPLAMAKKGDRSKVVRLSSKGPLRLRLMEMGLVPGTPVTTSGFAPLGDPMLLKVRGMELSLRKREAATIWIRPTLDGKEV